MRKLAKTNVLKLDKDCHVDDDWTDDYVSRVIVPVLASYGVAVKSVGMCLSKKKGMHLYVSVEPAVEPAFANKLEYLLGDDCRRVDFNRARIESNLPEASKLFEVAGRRLKTIYRAGKHG